MGPKVHILQAAAAAAGGVAPSIPDHIAGSVLFHIPPELPRGWHLETLVRSVLIVILKPLLQLLHYQPLHTSQVS